MQHVKRKNKSKVKKANTFQKVGRIAVLCGMGKFVALLVSTLGLANVVSNCHRLVSLQARFNLLKSKLNRN